MNSNTGAIARFETEKDARDAGYDVSLTEEEVAELEKMTRFQRLSLLKGLSPGQTISQALCKSLGDNPTRQMKRAARGRSR